MINDCVAIFGLGYDQISGIKALKKNYSIIGFDENTKAEGIKYVNKYYSTKFNKKNIIYKICKKNKVKHIFSFNIEAALPLVGYLNNKLKINGINQKQIELVTNKYKLRKKFKKKKILIPGFKILKLKKINKIIKGIQFPKIFKPVYGSGSRGIFIAKNSKEFLSYFSKNKKFFNKNILMESYIPGKIYAIDGWYKKSFIFAALTKKFRDRRFPLIDKSLIFNYDNSTIKKKAIELANRCCQAVNVNNVPIHLEFIIHKNKAYAIDFSVRGAGSQIYSKCISSLLGFSSAKIQINLQLKLKTQIKIKKKSLFYIYFLTSTKKAFMKKLNFNKLKIKKINFEYILFKKKGERINKIKNASDRLGIIYIQFNSQRKLIKNFLIINKILKTYDF